LDIDTGASTLVGVTAGALLATLGGLLAGQFEHHLRRLEREKSAALLFGEILAALRLILRLVDEAHGRGDPFGPITMRILRAAQRETQIYDRNRETLFDVRDPALRARTHLLLLQVGLTLDSIFEAAKFIEDSDVEGGEAAAIGRGAVAVASREGGFSFLMSFRPALPELIEKYEKIAKQSFDAHDLVLQGPQPEPAAS
jgi:hypothetical protein